MTAYLTKWGGLWGAVPQTGGRIFWVAPTASYTVDGRSYSASDDNDGLSPERALVTINRAWNLVTANVGDVVVLLPGTHSQTASITADIAGVTMTGLPGGAGNILRQKTTIDGTLADELINVTASNIELGYLHVIGSSAVAAINFSADADNLHIHHCSFDMVTPATSTSTIGIDAIGAASNVLINDCYFETDGPQGPSIDMTATLESLVENCVFLNTVSTIADQVTIGAATRGLIVKKCDFSATGTTSTVTDGIDGTASAQPRGVYVIDCRFSGTILNPVNGFTTATSCAVVESYQGTYGVTTLVSSALITIVD